MMNEQRMGNKCANCGKEIEEGARMCPFCGAMQEKHFGGQSSGTSYGSFNTDFNKQATLESLKTKRKRRNRIAAAIVAGCALIIAIICCVTYVSSYHDCGENATWEINGSTLTISGEGKMYDYNKCHYRSKSNEIERVIIEDGITSIGDGAFKGLEKLESVEIPDSVTSVGWNVFEECSSLSQVKLSENCDAIEWGMFEDCSSLVSIEIPEKVTRIDMDAFSGCTKLEKVLCESFEVWDDIYVSDSGNEALNECVYFADGTHLIRNASLQSGDEYSIEDETGISMGTWDVFAENKAYDCLSFDLQIQLSFISEGDPYGTFDIYILKSDGSYEKVSSMDITSTSEVTKRVNLAWAQSVKGVTVIPKAVGDLEYRYSVQMLNVIVED